MFTKTRKSAHGCEGRRCRSLVISVLFTIATVADRNVDRQVNAHKLEANSVALNSISRDTEVVLTEWYSHGIHDFPLCRIEPI